MVLEILLNVLYNIGLIGTIITIIASIIIVYKKKTSFMGIGKFVCIFLIFIWLGYLGVSIVSIKNVDKDNKNKNNRIGAYYKIKEMQTYNL